MPSEQELKLRTTVDGADEAARKLHDVEQAADAAAKSGSGTGSGGDRAQQTEKQAKATEKLTDAQNQQKASLSDLTEVINRMVPGLGEFIDTAGKGARVVGDLAHQQINLGKASQGAAKWIKNNSAALSTLAAGGGVAVGMLAIASAIHAMGMEAEEAARATQALNDALNELEAKRRDTKVDIEKASGARAEGASTAAESEQAAQAVERLGQRPGASFASAENRQAAVLLAGADKSSEALERIAILLETQSEINPEGLLALPLDERLGRLERMLDQHADELDKVLQRELTQRFGDQIKATQRELSSKDIGSTENIQEFIRNLPGGLAAGQDTEELARLVQALAGLSPEERANVSPFELQTMARPPQGFFSNLWDDFRLELAKQELSPRAEHMLGMAGNESPARIAELIVQLLQGQLANASPEELAKRIAELLEQSRASANITINQNVYPNQRVVTPSGRTQRGQTVNGRNNRDARGVG